MTGLAAVALVGMLLIFGVPGAFAHSLFNSAEQTIGEYRVQIATLPEFPQVGEESTLLVRITDRDHNEIDMVSMGIRVHFDGVQIRAYAPDLVEGGHWEGVIIFESPGNHIVKIDLYGDEGTTTYTFNLSTQSPFGYIFILAITAGAVLFGIIVSYIYLVPVITTRFRKRPAV